MVKGIAKTEIEYIPAKRLKELRKHQEPAGIFDIRKKIADSSGKSEKDSLLAHLEVVKRRDANLSFRSFLRSLEGDSSAIFRICKKLQTPSTCPSHHSPLLVEKR